MFKVQFTFLNAPEFVSFLFLQLERGLDLIKTGHVKLDGSDLVDDDTSVMKKRKINRYAGYTDAVWGVKTRGWAASTSRLDEKKWSMILKAAVEKMDLSGADEGDVEENGNGGASDPRGMIEIW